MQKASDGAGDRVMPAVRIAVALAACIGALAQANTIYRCSDGAGGVLYADSPCAGGRVVEVPASKVDPLARERLQRDLEAFDKRQALRDSERARQQEQLAQARRAEANAPPAETTEPAPYYPYAYGFAPYYVPPHPPPRPRPRPVRPRDSYIRVR